MQETEPAKSMAFTLFGMLVLGLADNTIPFVSGESSLWLFQAARSAITLPMIAVLALLGFGLVRAKRPVAVIGRSMFTATALLIYFGCLAFLPIGIVVAGLFTAPIFVQLISVMFRGQRVGAWRWGAVALGFVGALLVVWPEDGSLSLLSFLPIFAGLLYAIGAVATRSWCEGEDTLVLTGAYFVVLGVYGVLGMIVLHIWPQPFVEGPDGWLTRGWVPISGSMLFWTCVQGVGSIVGVACLTRGYQLGEASFVAVNEYALIVFASLAAWLIWGQAVGPVALLGMALIVASGVVIAIRSRAAA